MIRYAGGPIHVMMRPYRFVEDGLMIGKSETEEVVATISQKDHMWCRLDANTDEVQVDSEDQTARDDAILQQRNRLLFDRLAECLEQEETDLKCNDCQYPKKYGASKVHQFGGVKLCERCKEEWRVYAESLPERAIQVFPELATTELGLAMSRRA
ncbi:hypothetical protein QBC43DRAFT_289441 [Cladorrhinum sp. PSN259]|nr:hypothetical protein QBC43DRAFT_289441 [Cladorrhinum sp. PSN259]